MSSNTFLWVGLGLLLLIVIIVLYNMPRAKATRKWVAEKYRRQEEEARAEAIRMAKQMENFQKQRLIVYIREKDGRKSSFEAILIRMLLKSGITVEPLPESDGRAVAGGDTSLLKNGLLALVGTSWHKEGTGTDHGFIYEWEHTYCDYRLLVAGENGTGKILGAGCGHRDTSYEKTLADSIIDDLISTLPAPEAK